MSKKFLIFLFFIGVTFSIFGWVSQNLIFFPSILQKTFPKYYYLESGIKKLDMDEKVIITPNMKSFNYLLSIWQDEINSGLLDKIEITGIGRSTGITDIKNSKQYYLIYILTQNNQLRLDNLSVKDIDAKEKLKSLFNDSIFRFSSVIFIFGIFISSTIFILEINRKK